MDIEIRKRELRLSLDAHRRNLAPSLLQDICPGCSRRTANQVENKTPCRYYSPNNVYYDPALKRFWCLLWK